MTATTTNTTASTLRANLTAAKAAVLAPFAAILADLEAAGAVVETKAFLPAPGIRAEVRARVSVFDQAGRLFLAADLQAYAGQHLTGTCRNIPAGQWFDATAAQILAAARSARVTRVN